MTAPQGFPLAGRVMADLGQQVRAQRERARAAEAHAQQLTDALDAALKVLQEVEWINSDEFCPSCCGYLDDGHSDDCGLETALKVGAAAMERQR